MKNPTDANLSHLGVAAMVALFVTAVVTAAPSVADACSPSRCTADEFNLEDADVPASLPSFLWRPEVDRSREDSDGLENLEIKVFDTQTGDSLPVSAELVGRRTFHVDFDESLVPGRQYRFEGEQACESSGPSGYTATFDATKKHPRPSSLPKPSASPLKHGEVPLVAYAGGCGYPTQEIEAGYRHVRIARTDAAKPWVDVWETRAEIRRVGESKYRAWSPPKPVLRPPVDRRGLLETTLVTACKEPPKESQHLVASLEPGRYEVRFRASLPATDWDVQSKPTTVELNCPDTDGGEEDVGPRTDTGPRSDTGPETGTTDGRGPGWNEEGQSSGPRGCGGCSTPETPPLSPLLAGLAFLCLGLLRSRNLSSPFD